MLVPCIREVTASILNRRTGYPRCKLRSIQMNAALVSQIGPWLLPFKSFPTHYSLIVLSFDATWIELRVIAVFKETVISLHAVYKERSNKMQQCIKFYYSLLKWSLTCFGRTPPIIRSLKLHWQSLVFYTLKVVYTCSWWTLSGTLCLTTSSKCTYKQPSTYEKPETTSEVLGSWWWAVCRPKHVEHHINMK